MLCGFLVFGNVEVVVVDVDRVRKFEVVVCCCEFLNDGVGCNFEVWYWFVELLY